jgi:hypothetical protein
VLAKYITQYLAKRNTVFTVYHMLGNEAIKPLKSHEIFNLESEKKFFDNIHILKTKRLNRNKKNKININIIKKIWKTKSFQCFIPV